MFHNILVALDGSPDADQALTEAIDLAEGEHARLTLFTAVAQLPVTVYLTAGEERGELINDAHAQAEAILRRARERVPEDIPVSLLSEQPIRSALIRQIDDDHHDLVVIGSRGRGAVRAALLGSVSHYALHHAAAPVLIVHVDRPRAADTDQTHAAPEMAQQGQLLEPATGIHGGQRSGASQSTSR